MVKGHTYSEQLFESEAFRHFANIFLNKESGVTKGCEITQTSTTIEIGQGFFVILGGLLEEDTGTSMSIPTEAGYYRLVYEIDLSKVNTEVEFNQGSYKFVKGVGSYSNLTQEDLDNDGNVYQFEFCQFRVTEAGIQDFIDKRTFLNFDNIYEEIREKIDNIEDGSIYELKENALRTKILNQKVSVIANQEKTQEIDYTSIEGEIVGSVYVGSICTVSNRAGITKAIPQIGGIADSDMNKVTHIQICSGTTQDIYTSILVFYKESNNV